jgi:hypothetical protein
VGRPFARNRSGSDPGWTDRINIRPSPASLWRIVTVIGPTLTFLCTSSVRCYAYLAARAKRSHKIVPLALGTELALLCQHAIEGENKQSTSQRHDLYAVLALCVFGLHSLRAESLPRSSTNLCTIPQVYDPSHTVRTISQVYGPWPSQQMRFVEHDEVIEAFAPNRSGEALD